MDRRQFLSRTGAGLLGLFACPSLEWIDAKSKMDKTYSIVILGDIHFDADPASVYHSDYHENVKKHWEGIARNGKMWKEHLPRLIRRAHDLITPDTRMVFQMGDLVQGDCGNPVVHEKMLTDAFLYVKRAMGDIPFVTVTGNHDIRGLQAKEVYHRFMPQRMSEELGKEISKTTYYFTIGQDAYIFLDFNDPDDEELERALRETRGARHTFVTTHAPLLPTDSANCRWIFHGADTPVENAKRRYFRKLFAEREIINLCGHTHKTEFSDWHGDGGRITQMTMSSVWAKENENKYKIITQDISTYGKLRNKAQFSPTARGAVDESALFEEYRSSLKQYSRASAAGSYKLNVSKRHITVDFYGGDSEEITKTFVLREWSGDLLQMGG